MKLIYPGSWNPLHAGHLNIAHYAEKKFDEEVYFELCKSPIGKPKLTQDDVDRICLQFLMINRKLCVTNSPTFLAKAIFLHKTWEEQLTFLCGYDTIARIDNKDVSAFGSQKELDRCLDTMWDIGLKLYVFPRPDHSIDSLSDKVLRLCEFAGPDFVPSPLSSTEIRKASEYKPLTDLDKYARRKDFS